MNQAKSLILALLLTSSALCDDQIAFTYEMIRHGARTSGEDPQYFKLPPGTLTQSGMRQRLLMGKFNRERYTQRYSLIDQEFNPNQVFIQSTGYFRTIQSAYSEMLGLFPPGVKTQQKLLKKVQDLPMLKVRNQTKSDGWIDTLNLIPVYSYGPVGVVEDDAFMQGCPYTWSVKDYFDNRNDTFTDYFNEIIPVIKKPLQIAFDLSDDYMRTLSFNEANSFRDTLQTEDFEGGKPRYPFNAEQSYYFRYMQRLGLTIPLSKWLNATQLAMSKQIRKPVQIIRDKVDYILKNGQDERDSIKYLIHSTHDDSVANSLLFLEPLYFDFVDIPYSSSIFFELHYDTECVKTTKARSCFTVKPFYNNKLLKFDTCQDANQRRGSRSDYCQVDDFLKHIENISYKGDINQACLQKFIPPSN